MILFDFIFGEFLSTTIKFFEQSFMEIIVMNFFPPPCSSISDFNFKDGAAYRTTTFVHIADRSMVFHIGANAMQDMSVGIGDMDSRSLGVHNVLVLSNALANRALENIDDAIGRVSSERAKLGAIQNRLDHTVSNLVVSSENMADAESKIRDVDMAKEMMNFTRFNILSQAGISMLAQANQMSQGVLQLLR